MTSPTAPAATAPPPPKPSGLSTTQMVQLIALVQAQAAIRERLTQTAVVAVTAQLAGFDRWWNGPAVDTLVGRILRIVQATQLQMARVTDGFQARVLSIITGRQAHPIGAVDVTALRTALPAPVLAELAAQRARPLLIELGDTVDGPGDNINAVLPALTRQVAALDPAVPYRRLAEQYRYNIIAHGLSPEQAQAKVNARAVQVADTDVTLANRAQSRAVYERYGHELGILGYRRILHPERGAGGPPCGLCVVAADRVYRVENLKEIHDRCRCEVMPIVEGEIDPGLTLNMQDLDDIYRAAGGTAAWKLKKIRVGVAQHGELGPVLVDVGQRFRGPVDVARAADPATQLQTSEQALAQLRARADRGEPGLGEAIGWQTRRVDTLRRELADAGT